MVQNEDKTDRISKIRDTFCEGNSTLFAGKVGISRQQASSICNGSTNAGQKMLEKILDAFPEVNRAWLILGEGSMLTTPNNDASLSNKKSSGNTINNTGANSTNSINDSSINEVLMKMYEARLSDKDDVIDTLRDTIKTLQGEVEQLRAYVKLTSTKYIEVIERMRQTTNDTNDLVREATKHIGFKTPEE